MSQIRAKLIETLTNGDRRRLVDAVASMIDETNAVDSDDFDALIVDAIENRSPGETSDSAPLRIYVPEGLVESVARANAGQNILVLPLEAQP